MRREELTEDFLSLIQFFQFFIWKKINVQLIALRHDSDELYDEEQLNDENFTIKRILDFLAFLAVLWEFILEDLWFYLEF